MARLNEPPTAPANHTASTLVAAGGENVDACATMRTKSRPVPVPPPTDFLEVKRRFIRQNRELAKNNSSQSLRIRSLELEVSRLLSDNLELREKVFRLEGELFTARGKISSDAVRKVKDALLAKIGELSGVVEGLDEAAAEEQEPHSERSVGKPMMEGQWRERQPLAELMRDSQMPTIVEDKLFPRRTLNAEEIQAIRLSGTGSNESPDLGPPPVAHFDYGDPEKAPASPTQTSPSRAGEDDGLPGLSVNLETRRRRKDGQPKLEIRRHSLLPQSPEKSDTEPSTMLRTGAKRKLSDREIDQPIKPPTQADFTFSRKGESKAIVAETERGSESEPAQPLLVEIAQDVATTPSKPVRKVLGDKSVNQSPRKNNALATGKPNKPEKEDSRKPEKPASKSNPASARGQPRNRRGSNIPQPSPSLDDTNILPTVEIPPPTADVPTEPPPKTPAPPADIFSPTPSEPSARQPSQPETRAGTPPPTDLSNLSTTSTEGGGSAAGAGGRPSRRARSAVNYAEPSLVAKMRRPGRGMVDAVTGLQDSRRKSSTASGVTVTGERKVPDEEQQRKGRKIGEKEEVGDGEVFIKPEPTEDDEEAWKGLPCSSGAGEEGIIVKKEEEEKQEVGKPSGNPEEPHHTHSSSANLTAPHRNNNARQSPTDHPDSNDDRSRRRKRLSLQQQQPPSQSNTSTNANDEDLQSTTSKLAELDLYDFKDPASPSSPPSAAPSSHLPKAQAPTEEDSSETFERAEGSGSGFDFFGFGWSWDWDWGWKREDVCDWVRWAGFYDYRFRV
ncbi:hypothetical protein KC340_g8459 [Hortaea werneckii]|nr:hypothetical protein KC342_g16533 [Hortaea werneckii]KAI7106652.1 hypothetical protein KC339_g2940 [Hortaea werneckii]KAI7244671.1 hypothetical protein KC365_g1178 [Hortaea werneckii]KAI7316959.1 hypothetical protein KC340_g8459 [Hortaea werneckii]KAI7398399.1 hypothetical protein KC328_g4479 [Hortaea werneckii]